MADTSTECPCGRRNSVRNSELLIEKPNPRGLATLAVLIGAWVFASMTFDEIRPGRVCFPNKIPHTSERIMPFYCFRKRQALIENRTIAKMTSMVKFGHSALHGALFNVTPRMIVTI